MSKPPLREPGVTKESPPLKKPRSSTVKKPEPNSSGPAASRPQVKSPTLLEQAHDAYAQLRSPSAESGAQTNAALQNTEQEGQGSGVNTRAILIRILVDHHLDGNPYKLKLKDLADRAGISRQALDRYYGDLKPYMTGRRNVADLVEGKENKVRIESQTFVNEVQANHAQQLEKLKSQHKQALQKALDSHITSLMNNDILMLESTKIRTSLERQSLHNADLLKQNQLLNLKLAGTLDTTQAIAPGHQATKSDKVVFDLDLELLCSEYQRSKSIDAFEESKNAQLRKVRDKLNTYADSANVHVILFADRYISRFKTFADRYVGPREETSLIVRLPLFSRSETKNFTDALPRRFKVSIHVPHTASESEKKAHRVFMLQGLLLPAEEVRGADTADAPNINWGFDEVTFFKVHQGE